jgi:hypothetical protein
LPTRERIAGTERVEHRVAEPSANEREKRLAFECGVGCRELHGREPAGRDEVVSVEVRSTSPSESSRRPDHEGRQARHEVRVEPRIP